MIGRGWRVGSIGGIDIRIVPSWAIIALLITFSLELQFSSAYPTLTTAGAIGLAAVGAALFFGSVLVHELAHALVARRMGIRVRDITLFLFGGATQAEVDSRGAREEFLISIVGPATSALLGGALLGAAALGTPVLSAAAASMLRYLGVLNLLLAAFNLVPGFPLDGGRVLRSLLWAVTGSLDRATRIATSVGQAVGYLMVGAGAVVAFRGAFVSGIWLAAIGWFLARAARWAGTQGRLLRLLEGVQAGDLVLPDPVTVPAETTVHDAVVRYFGRSDQRAFPVEHNGAIVGILTSRSLERVPGTEWGAWLVGHVMEPAEPSAAVPADTPAERLLERFPDDDTPIFVQRQGRFVGAITRAQLGRYLSRRAAVTA